MRRYFRVSSNIIWRKNVVFQSGILIAVLSNISKSLIICTLFFITQMFSCLPNPDLNGGSTLSYVEAHLPNMAVGAHLILAFLPHDGSMYFKLDCVASQFLGPKGMKNKISPCWFSSWKLKIVYQRNYNIRSYNEGGTTSRLLKRWE
jgi:hypothetical protein